MYICPHVHFRGGKQSHKETTKHGLHVASRAGFSAVLDMPNKDPPILTRALALEQLKIAEETESPVEYFIYMGLTGDEKQIDEAVEAYNETPRIPGFKLYAGHSVGNLGVIEEDPQLRIYRRLAVRKYKGLVAVHCEKESVMRNDIWDPRIPISHAIARHPDAEVKSLEDQINFALKAGFEGTLHVAHISTPEAVNLVEENRKRMKITCGACPHHIVLDMGYMLKPDGLVYKMNPPLRPEAMRAELEGQARAGLIDWFETDHAPHLLREKLNKPYASGVPGLQFYPRFVKWLQIHGFDDDRIRDMTFNNIKKAYGKKLEHIKPREGCIPDMNLADEYGYDPFKDIKV